MGGTGTTETREERAPGLGERVLEDRVLGGEWRDWTGEATPGEDDLEPSVGVFLSLAGVVILMAAACTAFFWWLASPRMARLHPAAPEGVAGALVLVIGAAVVWWLLVALSASGWLPVFLRPLLPRRTLQKVLHSSLSPSVRLGHMVGLSRDRVFNSFIQVNNALVRGCRAQRLPGGLLLLLPRCMARSVRREILDLVNRYPLEVRTAGGGTGARRHVNELKPAAIVCVACERDLVSGIQDVAVETPVMALPNRRPHGPCKDTLVSAAEVRKAVLQMLECVGDPSSEADS